MRDTILVNLTEISLVSFVGLTATASTMKFVVALEDNARSWLKRDRNVPSIETVLSLFHAMEMCVRQYLNLERIVLETNSVLMTWSAMKEPALQ
jgi:hypothetical protein